MGGVDEWHHLRPLAAAVASGEIPGFFSRLAQALPLPRRFPDGGPVLLVPCGRGTLICRPEFPARLGQPHPPSLSAILQRGRAEPVGPADAIAVGPCRAAEEGSAWLVADLGRERLSWVAHGPEEESAMRAILGRVLPGARLDRADAAPPEGAGAARPEIGAYLRDVRGLPEDRRRAAYALVAIAALALLYCGVALWMGWSPLITGAVCLVAMAAGAYIAWSNAPGRLG